MSLYIIFFFIVEKKLVNDQLTFLSILKILNQLYLIDINKELIWLVKKWYTYNQSIRRKYGIILNYSMYYIDITSMSIRRKYGIILKYSMFYIKDIT